MKRRSVIKQIGAGLSAGIILPGWLSSCGNDDPKPDPGAVPRVAIVGAGAAGLFAADILKAKGIPVAVFEASDRIGGRVRSLKSTDKPSASLLFNSQSELGSDFPTELGAAQIIGSDSKWAKIVEELKLATVDLNASATDNYFIDGTFVENAAALADTDFIAAKNFFDNLASYSGGNGTVQQAIAASGISARMYAILNSWLGNKYGTSNDVLGIKGIAEAMNLITRNKTLLQITDNPMQDALLSRFSKVVVDVQKNSQVKTIDYAGSTVTVSGQRLDSGETFTTSFEKVIVTVPVSILKSGSIIFTPGLPAAKTTALGVMGMDPTLRVLLDFKANFWGLTSGFLYGGTDGPEYFNCGVGRSELTKTLGVTVCGPKAAALSLLGKNAIQVLVAELDVFFDGKATTHIRTDVNDNIIAVIQDWSLEPYIQGGTSYLKPGGTNQHRQNLAEAVDDKLFFAGEATDVTGEYGTLSGALYSGERAAQEVIDSL